MEKEEFQSEDVAMHATRYPIMSSLLSLPTMRNRLHVAYLSKKMKKWTALDTGKELRRLALEIAGVMANYELLIKDAFIMLARCKFHVQEFNRIVLECVPKTSMLSLATSGRSIAGVKLVSFDVVQSASDGYEFLAHGKCGELIKETKERWRQLVKMLVKVCQYRINFQLIDEAYKDATKSYNKLTYTTIPHLITTINRITMEQDRTRKKRLLKTFNNENKLWKGIDKLMRRLVVETVTGYDEENNNNNKENQKPTAVTKTTETHKDVEKVAPTSFMHRKVNNDPEISLIVNNADTAILNRASKTLECCEEEAVLPNTAPINSVIHNDVTIVPKTQKSLIDAELQVAVTNEVPKTLVNSDVQTAVLKNVSINSFIRNDKKIVSNKLTTLSSNNQIEKAEPNVDSKSFLIDFNDASKKTDKGPSQTFYLPIASILTHPTNLKVVKVVVKTSPITTLFPTKTSKHELVEKGVDPIQIMLPEDNELRSQQANLNYTFNAGILPTRIFDPVLTEESKKDDGSTDVTGQTPPKDDEETREDEDTPKKTKSPTKSQPVKETTSTANSTVLHNQQTTENVQQYSERNEQRQKQNTITIDDNPKVIPIQPSPEKKKTGKVKKKSVKNKEQADTSSQLPTEQTNLLMGTSTSKAVLPYYGSADKISEFIRGRELIVIKEPDEIDYDVDDFIPPVANKSYVIDSNIVKIETLDEDIESEDVEYDTHCDEHNDNDKQDLAEEAEVSETINPENRDLSCTAVTLTERVNITTTDLHSKCDAPTKQLSQSNLPVSDVSNDLENVASIEALKQYSANQREYSQDNSDFDSFRNLDEYSSSDEFDETLKQSSSVQNQRVYKIAECNSQNDPNLSEQIDKKVKDLANSEIDGSVAVVRRESGGS